MGPWDPQAKCEKAAVKEQLAIYHREVDRLGIIPATERSTGLKGVERSPERHNACFKILRHRR